MLTIQQYRLLKLAEECAEVAQRCSKQIQFGADEVQPGQILSNAERLRDELLDLFMWAKILMAHEAIAPIDVRHVERHYFDKLDKLDRAAELAQELGQLKR